MSLRYRIHGMTLEVEEPESLLRDRAAKKLGCPPDAILHVEVVKRSLDARKLPRWVYSLDVELANKPRSLPGDVVAAPRVTPLKDYIPRKKERIVIIGAGPAGLFAGLRLAQCGLEPIIVDRGEPVEIRGRHVSGLMHRGELRPDSNICFGEGGAGTWSDGKLYTRVNDDNVRHVLETIVALGGPPEILREGKPHLGTDRLVALCKAFRARLHELGAHVRFQSFVEEILFDEDRHGRKVKGVRLRNGDIIEADRVILAVGHSARQMYRHLANIGLPMEQKPFAVGFRVEHRQQLINEIQYGQWAELDLPTADYRVAANFGKGEQHRGVYSFCMCPGGQVVPSPTEPDGVCVNGMSHASRRGHFANSALVVTVKPGDFGAFGEIEGLGQFQGILDGMAFQKEAEKRAYRAGGGGFIAPAQRVTDFVAGRTGDVRETTYKPGIAPGDLRTLYPEFVVEHLLEGIRHFERRMPGFITDDAILIGVETRTSAPIQIIRDAESLSAPALRGLYPTGEGSGYGGGIVSAAVDGLRVTERILQELSE